VRSESANMGSRAGASVPETATAAMAVGTIVATKNASATAEAPKTAANAAARA